MNNTLVGKLIVASLFLLSCGRAIKNEIAPIEIMKPEERVEAYIRDWHKCWLKQGNGSPPTPTMMMNMAFLIQWETAIAEIGVVHWIDSSGNSSGISIPPEHDPEVEKVVTVAVNGDAAKVETKRKDDSFYKIH